VAFNPEQLSQKPNSPGNLEGALNLSEILHKVDKLSEIRPRAKYVEPVREPDNLDDIRERFKTEALFGEDLGNFYTRITVNNLVHKELADERMEREKDLWVDYLEKGWDVGAPSVLRHRINFLHDYYSDRRFKSVIETSDSGTITNKIIEVTQ
jgi:hypothetical protein